MNAPGLRVSVEREAIGLAARSARDIACAAGTITSDTAAGRQQQQRQAGDVVDTAQAEPIRPQRAARARREVEAGDDQRALERRCPSRCRRARGARARAPAPPRSRRRSNSASIVSDTRIRRVPADAGRAPRWPSSSSRRGPIRRRRARARRRARPARAAARAARRDRAASRCRRAAAAAPAPRFARPTMSSANDRRRRGSHHRSGEQPDQGVDDARRGGRRGSARCQTTSA